ncbi:MAG: hypothetical protein ACOYN2_01200 [Patescibacteria group bacterium]
MYRESNDAHFEKIRDFREIIEGFGADGSLFESFITPATQFTSLETLLTLADTPFQSLACSTQSRDIRTTIDAFLN